VASGQGSPASCRSCRASSFPVKIGDHERHMDLMASYASFATEACLIATLVRNGLFRVYRWFFWYLTADVLETAAGLVAQTNRRLYAQIYFAGQSIKIALAVLVVLELYRLALERHPALSHFGRM